MSRMTPHPKLKMSTSRLGGLECTLLSASDGSPPHFCTVLCHGFGAPGTDLVPLGTDLAEMCPELVGSHVFVFPQGPLSLADVGLPDGRAWWMVDIERYQRALERPADMARLRRQVPHGMAEASAMLRTVLDAVRNQFDIPPARTLLGGFSQGSMIATDVTLRLPTPPAGLCIFSGAVVAEDEWTELARKRGKIPVLQSHGHFDPILPFAAGQSLRELLTNAGLDVEFLPFAGPHTIPFEAMERLGSLLHRVFPLQ